MRRMSNLEELTLYVHIFNGPTFVAGTDLDERLLIHMPRLHAFSFYIACRNGNADPFHIAPQNAIVDPTIRVTNDQIERTFANGKYGQVMAMVDYFEPIKMICRVFSLPCKFSRLDEIGNNIPNVVFHTVTHVNLWDKDGFTHEFFLRLARSFPCLQNLSLWVMKPPSWGFSQCHLLEWCSVVEYPHLISLDIGGAHFYYVEHLLNERKTHLPRLTELTVDYNSLQGVTQNFTRIETVISSTSNGSRGKFLSLFSFIVSLIFL